MLLRKFYRDTSGATHQITSSDHSALPASYVEISEAEFRAAQSLPVAKHLSRHQFLHRFTAAEQDTLIAAKETDPVMKRWWLNYDTAAYVNLDDPRVDAGLDYLISKAYIASTRKAALLAWP